jgi:Ca2+-transporting ATPase
MRVAANHEPFATAGLSDGEAALRLARYGPNEIPGQSRRGTARIAADLLREPMLLLLIAAGAIYLALGSTGEALILAVGIALVVAIEVYQEQRTERALEALRDLSSPRALVVRGGRQLRIAGRSVVPGDVIILAEGDRVPADGRLVWSARLEVDESLLTGESMPVRKGPEEPEAEKQRDAAVYSGTLVVRGRGIAVVERTGAETELGRIGRSLEVLETGDTPMRRETRRVVRILGAAGAALCLLVAALYAALVGSWLRGLLAGVSLAISMTPEEFPVVLTVFLALGAWRMSKRQVLTRRAQAIEALGAATVLCADKTGTMTFNRMAVARLACDEDVWLASDGGDPLPERFHRLAEFMLLASQRDPIDPMERALEDFGRKQLAGTEHLHASWSPVREYPLSDELLALSHVWRDPTSTRFVIAAKGSAEAIADLCHLPATVVARLMRRVDAMAADGLRVIAVAYAYFGRGELPAHQHEFDFEPLGLVGLADPPRPMVRDAVEQCRAAGIRVLMITGDHPATARRVALEAGLDADAVMTGSEMRVMTEGELSERVRTTSIFARFRPDQKLRLVRALQGRGEIVAMTGDGVNDAPALKAAHIGIAMGERGSDVAREAASIILLDDDFGSLVAAVRMGRRIYDNLRHAMTFVVAAHVPIAGVALIPLLLRWPLVLFPVHIAFLELIIDPACSLAFEAEPEDEEIMRRPPREPSESLFSPRLIWLGALQGAAVLVTVMGVFASALHRGLLDADARTLTFATLILSYLGLILGNRSWASPLLSSLRRRNPIVWWVCGGALALLAAILGVPAARSIFQFTPLHPDDIALCAGSALLATLAIELLKYVLTGRGRGFGPRALVKSTGR